MSDFLRGTKTQDMHTDVNFKLSKGIYKVSKVLKKYLIQKQLFIVKKQTKIPKWTGDKQGIAYQWEKLKLGLLKKAYEQISKSSFGKGLGHGFRHWRS